MPLDLSSEDVITTSQQSASHPYGFRYVVVELQDGDVMDNPASTNRRVYGPGVWLWEIHPSGITAREYDGVETIPAELRNGARIVSAAEQLADHLDNVFPGFKQVTG